MGGNGGKGIGGCNIVLLNYSMGGEGAERDGREGREGRGEQGEGKGAGTYERLLV